MKRLLKVALAITLITLFATCQSGTDVNQTLLKPDTRKEMMDKIAEDSTMSKEMMTAMMNSNNGMAMMQNHQKMMMQNHESMMKMMKDNPSMMQSMMSAMMETAKGDTSMMSSMCKTIMSNQPMMDMMQKMKGEKSMKMGGMNK
ncbi:MAG: membrane or secreted protein [Chitinophagaceae bacterium]|nr:MAG: membrane or secreted protein [Chitinophagaceae bacterium]